MTILIKTSCCIFLFFVSLFLNIALAKDIFVSATNTQAGDGSLLNPFKTIQQAANIAQPGDVVNIRAGVYREEVKMPTDGVVYQSYQNETVTINGNQVLSNWTVIPNSAVYQTTMDFNAPNNESLRHPSNQLFVNQQMIQYARWPDQTSNNLCIPTDALVQEISADRNLATFTVSSFNEPDGRWVGASIFLNLSIGGNDGIGWTGVVTATSKANHTITFNFRERPRLANGPFQMGERTEFYLFNPTKAGVEATGGVAALLSPGEWWKTDNKIYVHTPNGLAPNNDTTSGTNTVEAKKRDFAFSSSSNTDNRSNYTIRKLNLFGCTISTDVKSNSRFNVVVEDAHDIILDGLTAKYISHFTNSAGNWQSQWYGRSGFVVSGRNNVIKNCDIKYAAGPGICLLGVGNKILNNTISEVNYTCSNAGAISTSSVCIDGEIGYNTIFNTTVMGINFGGLTNSDPNKKGIARIHHNRIYNCLLRSNDSGYIDATGLDGNWGRMDHNLIYKTFSPNRTPYAAYAIYFDFNPGKWFVDHNVVYGLNESILINNSPNLSIYNNTLISPIGGQVNIGDCCNYGTADTIRNNIFSSPVNSNSLSKAVISNNLFNANVNASTLFVNAQQRNYQLKSTATNAIDKGVNYFLFNDPFIGNVDLGAFEFGKSGWVVGPTTNLPPTITPNSGELIDSATVNIKTEITGDNVTIRYTVNGSIPNLNSALFTQPFTITDSLYIKAVVFVDSVAVTDVATANIYVTQRKNIPSLQVLISEPTGNYPVQTFVILSTEGTDFKEIRYTLDGSEPTKNSTFYAGNLIFVNESLTIKAKAFGKLAVSEVATSVITIIGPPVTISPNGGVIDKQTAVNLTTQFRESVIYYTTDGSIPTSASTVYTNPIIVVSNTTINAIGIVNNKISEVATATFITSSLQNVLINPNGGAFVDNVDVSLSTGLPNASIYYTLNDETPTANSTLYTNQPIKIENTRKIKSVAILNGLVGNVSEALFTITGPNVVILPASGTQTDVFTCTIASVNGAAIYYTLDGSIPTSASTLYVTPISVNSYTTQIKAVAIRNQNVGEVSEVNYTIAKPTVTITPNGATAQNELSVSIASSLPNSIIYYTLDGITQPSTASLIYTAPLLIKSNVLLKAFAIKGQLQSNIVEANFNVTINDKFISIYPNPANNGQFKLRFNKPQKGQTIQVVIYNILGKFLYKKNVNITSVNAQEETFNLPFLKPGIYFVKMRTVSAHVNNLVNEDLKLIIN